MSFPTIPDITPEIDINREDAINLLLISVALEEFSLADLIDAEVKKICCIVKNCETKNNADELKEINRSVDQTLKDIIKMQMLLQFKLENIQEIICPCPTTTTSTSTSTSTTTTTTTATKTTTTATTTSKTTTTTTKTSTTTTKTASTTTKSTTKSTTTTTKSTTTVSTTSTRTTTTKKKCKFCLPCKAHGCVSNKCDCFYDGTASVKASVSNSYCSKFNNKLIYCVKKNDMSECVKASPCSIKIECPSIKNKFAFKIRGKCSIIKKICSQHDIIDTGKFELIIRETFWEKSFRMVIFADNKPGLNHDSGKVVIHDFDLIFGK